MENHQKFQEITICWMVRLIQNFTVKAIYKCCFIVIYNFHKSSFFVKLKKYVVHSYVRKMISVKHSVTEVS